MMTIAGGIILAFLAIVFWRVILGLILIAFWVSVASIAGFYVYAAVVS